MLNKLRSLRDTVDDTTSTIRSILWMLGVVAVIIIFIRQWLKSLDAIQTVALWVTLSCLGLIIVTYYLDWQKKRNVDKIPELLAQLDTLTLDYIENYRAVPTPETLLNDLAKIFNVDIGELKAAAFSGNKKRAETEFERFTNNFSKYANAKKFQENIMTLRLAGGLMNEYHVGLASITNTQEYQHIYQRVRILRRRAPSAAISAKINEYFNESEGLYSLLLSVQPFASLGSLKEMIPARIRAQQDVTLPIIEGHLDTLISSVRESIDDYKHKNKEYKDKTEKNKEKR
jgi:hypothetical protein